LAPYHQAVPPSRAAQPCRPGIAAKLWRARQPAPCRNLHTPTVV